MRRRVRVGTGCVGVGVRPLLLSPLGSSLDVTPVNLEFRQDGRPRCVLLAAWVISCLLHLLLVHPLPPLRILLPIPRLRGRPARKLLAEWGVLMPLRHIRLLLLRAPLSLRLGLRYELLVRKRPSLLHVRIGRRGRRRSSCP